MGAKVNQEGLHLELCPCGSASGRIGRMVGGFRVNISGQTTPRNLPRFAVLAESTPSVEMGYPVAFCTITYYM
jgi:hypothetical protein